MKTFEKIQIYIIKKIILKDKKTMRQFNNIYKNNVDIYADSFNWDKQVRCACMLRDIVNS